MFQSRLKKMEERPRPKPGRAESVIPTKDLKKIKGDLQPKVPAFEVIAKIAMYWDGLCIDAGHNWVDVAKFEALPRKTRKAFKEQIVEGAFKMRGYPEAKAKLEELTPKAAAKPTVKKPDPARQAEADAIEIEDEEVLEDEPPADSADVLG